MTSLAALIGTIALTVIPTVNKDRTLTRGQPRGPDEPRVYDVVARGEVPRELAGRTRIAVLPFRYTGSDPDLRDQGLGCMAAIAADLRYVPRYLVVDRSEVRAALAQLGPGASPAELGKALGAGEVIVGTLSESGGKVRLEARLLKVAGGNDDVRASATAERPKSALDELTDAALTDLLRRIDALPGPRALAQMAVVPTRDLAARAACDEGAALLDQAGTFRDSDGARVAAEHALEAADRALKLDPKDAQAHVLKVSCLLALDRDEDAKAALKAARRVRLAADELTALELDGDYYLLAEKDFAKASRCYERMLAIDPGNHRALWSLILLHSGEVPTNKEVGPADLAAAGAYAARLAAAHPGSPLVTVFKR